ncbi:MAG: 30S ribosomal protein S8 [Proteobacteria bacterium]|nr:30S ribosomal protein S8 [Pseudomonadota bacterium]
MDTIANLLSTIKNASMVRKESIELPFSKMNESILNILKEKGFINNVKVFKHKDSVIKGLHVDLKYSETEKPFISEIKRVSKPGRRIYLGSKELEIVRNGFGIGIVSTSRGLMTTDEAKKKKLGGEVICEIY